MPECGFPATPKAEQLTADEICRIVRIAADIGIAKVRITGGEPLLRKDLPEIVRAVAAHPGIRDISCTTNGFLLAEQAAKLREAGLHRINVSLDTLDEERFMAIARRGSLPKVREGIAAARQAGLEPIKINCVVMRGFNEQEVVEFARWTLEEEIHIRFIELMPIRWQLDDTTPYEEQHLLQVRIAPGDMLGDAQMRRMFVPAQEILDRITQALGPLEGAQVTTNGPARTYKLKGANGTVGVISQITNDFCSRCNRLRLTHDGYLRPCLMSDGELDLRTPLRSGAGDDELIDLIRHVVRHKPERHYLAEGQKVVGRGMSQIGG
jgi:cyclic pyranopterin phosphate synthase